MTANILGGAGGFTPVVADPNGPQSAPMQSNGQAYQTPAQQQYSSMLSNALGTSGQQKATQSGAPAWTNVNGTMTLVGNPQQQQPVQQQAQQPVSNVGGVGQGSSINGQLPLANSANSLLAPNLGQGYYDAYTSALQQNQQNYNNILQGYQQTAASQRAAQQQIQQGYGNLGNQVQGYLSPMGTALNTQMQAQQQTQQGYGSLSNTIQNQSLAPLTTGLNYMQSQQPQIQAGYSNLQSQLGGGYGSLSAQVQNTIQGIDASQRQAISDAYTQQQGATTQQTTNQGLGNTTVVNSLQRGNLLDEQKADVALSNQTAALQAGYQANLGLAGLGSQQTLGLSGLANQSQALQAQVNQQNLIGGQQAAYMQSVGLPQLQNQAANTAANTAQTNAYANAQAGYGTQIGLAGLNYANAANQQNTGLAEDQLRFQNSVNSAYPNPQAYQNLAQQAGANKAGAPSKPVSSGGGGKPGGGIPVGSGVNYTPPDDESGSGGSETVPPFSISGFGDNGGTTGGGDFGGDPGGSGYFEPYTPDPGAGQNAGPFYPGAGQTYGGSDPSSGQNYSGADSSGGDWGGGTTGPTGDAGTQGQPGQAYQGDANYHYWISVDPATGQGTPNIAYLQTPEGQQSLSQNAAWLSTANPTIWQQILKLGLYRG